jgi:uncharacterized RDD family membrane protein YckC
MRLPGAYDVTLPSVARGADDDTRIGQTLGHYKIESQLGRGGMGTVYRALDESLQRYVALKVIDRRVKSVSDTQQLQRLCQEALAQARVNHPHVAHIYYVGHDEGCPFLAMELVGNETLADRLRTGPLPYQKVIELGGQLCDALRHCQAYDIVHGDIKPSNVLLADIGFAKLSDFGLARRLSENRDDGGNISGTPDYLAPEVINGGSTDVRSDLYALGVTLFEMTFGRLPFSYSGSSIVERLEAHKSAPIVFPQRWPSEVPYGWREVLERLLEKNPDERYQDYDELIQDLERMRPAKLPKAGRIPRILAWCVDATMVYLMFAFLAVSVSVIGMLQKFDGNVILGFIVSLVFGLFAAIAGSIPLMLASAIQGYWGTTLGKKLFQIRIVDAHGLRPLQSTLAIRMALQMLPIWGRVAITVFSAVQVPMIGYIVYAILLPCWLASVGVGLIRRDGRSLHDRILGTRVVLDATLR